MTPRRLPLQHALYAVGSAPDVPGLIGVDGDGLIWRWDAATEAIYGRTAAQMTGRSVASLAVDQDVDVLAWVQGAIATGDPTDTLTTSAVRPDHWAAPVSLQVSPMPLAISSRRALIFVRQLGEHRPDPHAELVAMRRRIRVLEAMIDNSAAAFVVFDDHMVITQVGNVATLPSGWEPDDFAGRPAQHFVHRDDKARIELLLSYVVARPGCHPPVVVKALTAHGEPIWLEARLNNALDTPDVRGVIGTFVNVTDRLDSEHRLRHLALHDPLTGLGNRTLLAEHLARARTAQRNGQATLVLIDLCDLGMVNTRLGHRVGDQVLCHAAERLRRRADATDTVVRLTGDQFAVLRESSMTEPDAVTFARALIAGVAGPTDIGGEQLQLQATAGVIVATVADDLDELLRRAGLALARARLRGRGSVEVFTAALEADSSMHDKVVAGLRVLNFDRDLRVAYQPIVNLATGHRIGAEALLRWTHPTLGPIPPSVFISIAETIGVIVEIGRWALRQACRSAAEWDTADGHPITLSVNVSPRQLEGVAFVDDVNGALTDAGLDPHRLILEVTETAMLEHNTAAVVALTTLASQGVRIAIDDFGTGYATLTYLKQWPVDIIKIDRSFIAGLGIDEHDTAIVASVVSLAYALGVQVTAEGVETAEQRDRLIGLGCTHGQGFLFGAPTEAIRPDTASSPG